MTMVPGHSLTRASRSGLAPAVGLLLLTATSVGAQITPEPGTAATAPQGQVDFTQVTRPVVQITDSATIEFLLFELFIAPLEPPNRLHVIDVTQNGFGPDDIVIAYPTVEAFLIPEFLPEEVLQLMGQWLPEIEYRMDSGNVPEEALAALVESQADDARRAESAIMYDVVQAVDRSYNDLPVSILFQRDSVGFTFQLWDYRQEHMRYEPRATFATESEVKEVVGLLREVGYVPGEGVVGLGRSLASAGAAVASPEQALAGVATLPDPHIRTLAARTVLVGSYDFDRSGAIDRAREIDAPPCAVWSGLEQAFPGFLSAFGFDDPQADYTGNVALNIHRNVRAPAAARAGACLRGETPEPTDPDSVPEPEPEAQVAPALSSFAGLSAGAEIVRRAGPMGGGSAGWMREVRDILVSRYDRDRSGLLDHVTEVRTVPCEVWTAIESTHGGLGDAWLAGQEYVGEEIGIATELRREAVVRLRSCDGSGARSAFVVPVSRSTTLQLPPESIRAAVTIPLQALGSVEEEERRFLPAKTVLLTMFDLDRSGVIDTGAELDAIPCETWRALDVTFPGYAERFGFVRPEPRRPYRGNLTLSIAAALQGPAEGRITACMEGRPLTPTEDPPQQDFSGGRKVEVTPELRRFLDLEAAAVVVRTAAGFQPGSAAWALAVRSTLTRHFDFDASGSLDRAEEVQAVPCVVWTTIESTYGGALPSLGTSPAGAFLAEEMGIPVGQRRHADARIAACR